MRILPGPYTGTGALGQSISDPAYRRDYYATSYRFVKYLVEKSGMDVFMQLYESDDPESRYADLYGASREALVRRRGSEATMNEQADSAGLPVIAMPV